MNYIGDAGPTSPLEPDRHTVIRETLKSLRGVFNEHIDQLDDHGAHIEVLRALTPVSEALNRAQMLAVYDAHGVLNKLDTGGTAA